MIKKYLVLWGALLSLSLTACSSFDVMFEEQAETKADPYHPASDPMVQDNERRIRDAREDGRLGSDFLKPRYPVKFQ
ncbi:hypothetical protein [Shewanella scandinavica]|uniref:Lipoprotein n=1 Tax=Shewanella scandinavica TaxID=3063538 RepID=A0ABU3FZP1_9GAMM|nr:hypothetical protein [Shewanella sp. SP2S1-2]MDT3280532.1 hypothetical protein [Shewanella sp. SP2S1-2]